MATHRLNDLGAEGDYQSADGNFEAMYLSLPGTYVIFKVYDKHDNLIREIRGNFNGNIIAPVSVSVINDTFSPSLQWQGVTGADEYWIRIWGADKNFATNGYVDISQKVSEFSTSDGGINYDENEELYSIILEGQLMQLPLGNYYWMVIAEGTGGENVDGNSAAGGLLRVVPEPAIGILFAFGSIFLATTLKYKRRKKRINRGRHL